MTLWLLLPWEGPCRSVGKAHGSSRVSGAPGVALAEMEEKEQKGFPIPARREGLRPGVSPPRRRVHQSQEIMDGMGKLSHSCPKAALASPLDAVALHRAQDLPPVYYPAQSGFELVT